MDSWPPCATRSRRVGSVEDRGVVALSGCNRTDIGMELLMISRRKSRECMYHI